MGAQPLQQPQQQQAGLPTPAWVAPVAATTPNGPATHAPAPPSFAPVQAFQPGRGPRANVVQPGAPVAPVYAQPAAGVAPHAAPASPAAPTPRTCPFQHALKNDVPAAIRSQVTPSELTPQDGVLVKEGAHAPESTPITIVTTAAAEYFPLFSAAWGTFGILLCYGLAVMLGHVPIFLPMISDCGVHPPELYIFRFVLIPTAMYIMRVKYLAKDFIKSAVPLTPTDDRAATIAGIAAVCLGIVGAVNEKEDNDIHTTAAVIFFVLSVIYMTMMVKRLKSINESRPAHDPLVSEHSLRHKRSLIVVLVITTVLFVIAKGYDRRVGNINPALGFPTQPMESVGRLLLAMLEWTTTIGIIIGYATFAPDFKARGFLTGTFICSSPTASPAVKVVA
eukprot:TRINITY_DN3357_c0_g1_i3.p2 TRINITY_DN3357_c0_g1~~TRINITY_DN3357_c0_g1_i3.p2  ORF type:complete len:392 (+),score=104.41 TRINITY_DN3357_c0_g1_i3:325-1500(+)